VRLYVGFPDLSGERRAETCARGDLIDCNERRTKFGKAGRDFSKGRGRFCFGLVIERQMRELLFG
jgi:hypothetical protein